MKYTKILLYTLIIFIISSCCPKASEQQKNKVHYGAGINKLEQPATICFGSCNKQWMDQSYWKNIKDQDPDLWIWMGDIIYCDTEDMEQMQQQYDFQKNHEEYRDFIASIPILGVWDDHDYGVNDGGSEYPKKEECRDILYDFLDIPEKSIHRNQAGAYQSYSLGMPGKKIKVILLDGRYFRDKLAADHKSQHRYLPNETGTYLGEEQWKWLENELKTSRAQFHLFVSGVQVIPTQHYFEKWANFPNERNRLFDLIIETGIKNPFFISGDRHIAEMMRLNYNDHTFYELTSSGMTHSYEKADEENQYRISPLISTKNFGSLKFIWANRDSLSLIARIHNMDGTVNFEKHLILE